MNLCKNCGNIFEGKFCNNCGQKEDTQRFTIKHALHEFFRSFTHLDRGILFLMKEMFIRPGIVAGEYIDGKRKKYFSPMQYLILGVALNTFITIKFGIIGLKELPPEVYTTLNDTQKFFLQFNNFIYTYFNLTLFANVPVMALFSRLVYYKSGYNYSEHFIFNTFIAGQRSILYFILAPIMYILKEKWYIGIGIYYLIFLIYFYWAYIQFFRSKVLAGILKFTAVFIFSWAAMQFITMAVFYLFFYKP